ncbi:hypothetical protein [Streptomyces sp. NPDC096311]|uniref:hypothetical protein n=1 Tax=Streptomyces sp. NPDC096311 TaxID=3366083 RepID=UPI00381B7B81
MRRALGDLTPSQEQSLTLRFWQELPYFEIARRRWTTSWPSGNSGTAPEGTRRPEESMFKGLAPISTLWTNADIAQQAVDRVLAGLPAADQL